MASRPKRKASQNKNYNDNDEAEFERMIDNNPDGSKKQKTSKRSSNSSSSSSFSATYTNYQPITSSSATPPLADSVDATALIPSNWQPPLTPDDYFSDHLNLQDAYVRNNTLYCVDGVTLSKHECIYMISEPPGEPYYIGRILGFEKKDKNNDTESASNYLFRITWLYRPRDISKHATDSRLLFASMHTDTCPLMSFKGKAVVRHKADIEDVEEYRVAPNHFWFEKLFDRYMIKFYDVLPTSQLANLPPNYYKALNKRFEFIFVENGKSKDFLSDLKNCEKCSQWCSSVDSVTCVHCSDHYHMLCLSPPLLRKPTRGFGWSCASCSKAAEEKLLEQKGDLLNNNSKRGSSQESESVSETNEDANPDDDDEEEEREERSSGNKIPKYEELAVVFLEKDKALTLQQRRNIEEWPYRYLGMHARLEDALDLEDRPYPRAASRLGSKHQVTSLPYWHGSPFIYYDKSDTGNSTPKKKQRGGNYRKRELDRQKEEEFKQRKLEIPQEYKDTELKELPPWVVPRPKGYIERGLDEDEAPGQATSHLLWKQPEDEVLTEKIDAFLSTTLEQYSKPLGITPNSPNLYDAVLKSLLKNNYNFEKAIEEIKLFTRKSLKEPTFSAKEVQKFEDGVRKYGSELYPVFKEVQTQSAAMIVRFYYMWKKTKNGHLIWDNFEGRKKKKVQETTTTVHPHESKVVEDIANSDDDSSYDMQKSLDAKKTFLCKHCKTNYSTQWFRITTFHASTDHPDDVVALCMRCARLWRRYAVIWEEPQDVMKKLMQRGGNGWKRKVEVELATDSEAILNERERVKTGVITPVPTNGKRAYRKQSPKRSTPPPELPRKVFKAETTPVPKQQLPSTLVKEESEIMSSPVPPAPKKRGAPRKQAKAEAASAIAVNSTGETSVVVEEEKETKRKYTKGKSDKASGTTKKAKIEEPKDPSPDVFRAGIPRTNPDYILSDNSELSLFSESVTTNLKLAKQFTNYFNMKSTSLPIFPPDSRPCSICRSSGGLDEVIICSNCGLNVHSSCYGVYTDGVSYDKKWFCDPCANDLHPLLSTYYSCCLCFAREIDHDACITGSPNVIPDALKRTDTNHWCHVLCALFADCCTFGDTSTLQPVRGISASLLATDLAWCGICHGKGGTIASCKYCNDRVHISCAQDRAFFIGFEIQATGDKEKNVKLENGLSGKPHPVIVCGQCDSGKDSLVSLRSMAKRNKFAPFLPLIQIYYEDYMKDPSKLTGTSLRAAEYRKLRGLVDPKTADQAQIEPVVTTYSCVNCNSKKSPKWWDDPSGGEYIDSNKKLCHSCYIKLTNPSIITEEMEVYDTINEENNLLKWINQPLSAADYGLEDPLDSINQINEKKVVVTKKVSLGDLLS